MKAALALLLIALGQQTPGPLFVVGTVVDVHTGRPIVGALVALTRAPSASTQEVLRTKTDPGGRFLFQNLESAHQIDVSASGYLPLARAIPLVLREPSNLGLISLTPYRQIAGSLADSRGVPLSGVTVSAFSSDLRRETAAMLSATTDDEGRYSIERVPPGEYHVCAVSTTVSIARRVPSGFGGGSISDAPLVSVTGGYVQVGLKGLRQPSALAMEIHGGRPAVAPTSCYPAGADISSAGPVEVAANNRNGIDIVAARQSTVNVTGRIIPLPDREVRGAEIRLVPAVVDEARAETHLEAALTEVDNDGTFSFVGVVPGSYRLALEVEHPSAAGTVYDFVSEPVAVGDSDVSGITVPMRSGLRLTGRLEFHGRFPTSPVGGLVIQFESAKVRTGGWPNIRVKTLTDASGAFELAGLLPGVYRLTAQLPQGQVMAGVMAPDHLANGNAVELRGDLAIAVVSTNAVSAVDISTDGNLARPLETRDAWIFPEDPEAWRSAWSDRLRFQTVPLSGPTTRVTGLPPGRYLIAVVDRLKGYQSWSASTLGVLARTAVTVELRADAVASVRAKVGG